MAIPILLFGAGILILYLGAEWLVRGSSQLALNFGISPVIVGLTVVAFGTSAPELVAGLQAHLIENNGDIVIGNVIGSNIYNVGIVLGLAALASPIEVHSDIVRREAPLAIGVSGLLLLMMMNNILQPWEGAILLVLFILYILFQLKLARSGKAEDTLAKELVEELDKPTKKNTPFLVFLIVIGVGALMIGANLLITNAVKIANYVGIPQTVTGLILVAFGTSLPELATTVMAAIKKERDLAVANVIGSNIFNILLILGTTAVLKPIQFDSILWKRDGVFMVIVIVLMMLLVIRKKMLRRWQGGLLLTICLAYGLYLVLAQGDNVPTLP